MTSNRIPGLIDPPTVADNVNLQQWMVQVTEILRLTTGQVGTIDSSLVTWGDMVASGLFQPVANHQVVTPFNSGDYANGQMIKTVEGFDLTPPGKVEAVVVSSLVGAMDIEWLPPAMAFPHYFELWRSNTGSVDDRVLIGSSTANRYSDVNVDDGITYTYWVRVAKTIGNNVVYSAYDTVEGTVGTPRSTADNILDVVSEGMYIATPGGNKNPFTYLNLGTEEAPDWAIALRADVAVQGSLAISQLQTGELPDKVSFSIGQASITMDTRSDGSGQILLTGKGGISGNDYLLMNQGRIASYVWNGTEHVPYKEVRRIERGVTSANQQVSIPAYFKSQPTVYLAPFIIPTYNPEYPTQSQQWRLSHSNVEPNPRESGGWVFTPTAQLELGEGSATLVYPDRTYNGSSNNHETVISNRTSLKKCRINARFKSVRSTTQAGVYYNRTVTVHGWYRPVGTDLWQLGASKTTSIGQFNDAFATLDIIVPSVGNYDIKVSYTAADAGGTFSTGAQYEYKTRTLDASPSSVLVAAYSSNSMTVNPESASVSVSGYTLSGWTIYKTVWSYRYRGEGYIDLPHTYGLENSYISGTKTLTFNQISTTLSVGAGRSTPAHYGYAGIDEVTATYHYRRAIKSETTTINNFYLDSIEYDQGAQQINPTDETILINWLAVGE